MQNLTVENESRKEPTMTNQLSPSAPPPGPAQSHQNVAFRMLTPVFNYQIEGNGRFSHSGQYRNARFEILLRPYKHEQSDFDEVTCYCSESIRQLQGLREFPHSRHFMQTANYVLLVDTRQPAAQYQNNTSEGMHVLQAALNAFRLHSSAGLPSHDTYIWRDPPPLHPGLHTHCPNAYQNRFSHLSPVSELRQAEFAPCQATIDSLVSKTWNNQLTFDSVLSLAMEYDRVCFTLEHVEHAFLILMTAFEALFKKDATEKASKAAVRIGRLLGKSKRGCKDIQGAFFDDPRAYSKIRNQVAHGDPGLNVSNVQALYPGLHGYVKQAMIELLAMPAGTLDTTKNYYDEITRLVDARFNSLPPK
jgi:hypothetical protein